MVLKGFYHGKGSFYFSNGDSYTGLFFNGYRHGEGTYHWSDNSSWKGNFVYDNMEGKGIYRYPFSPYTQIIIKEKNKTVKSYVINKNNHYQIIHEDKKYQRIIYELNSMVPIFDDKIVVTKEIKLSDNETYFGEISNDVFHGRGSFIVHNKINELSGEKIKFKRHHVKYYVGYWENNLKNGKGKYFNSDFELIYYGDFKNDKIDGKGRYYFYDTDSYYDGEFSKGQKHGKGVFYWNNNSRFEGNFLNDKIDGKGIFYYNNFNISDLIEFDQGNIVSRSSYKVYNSKDWKLETLKKINQLKLEREEILDKIKTLAPGIDDNCLEWVEILFKNGIYIGQVNSLNNPHGRGAFYYNHENKYNIGYWENGNKYGFGFEYKKDSNQLTYEGNFKFDLKSGKGKYYIDNNIEYEGIFDHLGNGWGIYQFEDKSFLKGNFVLHLPHGECLYYDKYIKLLGKCNYNHGDLIISENDFK